MRSEWPNHAAANPDKHGPTRVVLMKTENPEVLAVVFVSGSTLFIRRCLELP
jgi:hypothetical protein